MSDELKIVLEDVKEKFDTVIEAFNMVTGRLDCHEQAEEERFNRLKNDMLDTYTLKSENLSLTFWGPFLSC